MFEYLGRFEFLKTKSINLLHPKKESSRCNRLSQIKPTFPLNNIDPSLSLCKYATFCLFSAFGPLSVFVKWELEGSSQFPLGTDSWWCEIFETENPLGWLPLQFNFIQYYF